ncbi:unnamed protein product, partial [Pylaiella littoralis]
PCLRVVRAARRRARGCGPQMQGVWRRQDRRGSNCRGRTGGAGVGSAAKAHGLGRHDLANLDGAGGGAGGQQSRAAVKKERHVANSEAKRAEESKATAKFRAEALKA